MATTDQSKNTVLAFINALNSEDFAAARSLVTDDLKFEGVMGARDGADVYMDDMKKMKFKYDVKKAFADGDDVCLFYDVKMGDKTIFSAGWYKVSGDKVKSFKVIFDPRPLLD
jgi:limonene-1,2-epoxide hydrolase